MKKLALLGSLLGLALLLVLIVVRLQSPRMETEIHIPPYGVFSAERLSVDNSIFCYKLSRDLRGRATEYIIYPRSDARRYSEEDRSRIAKKIALFEQRVENAIRASIGKVRSFSLTYGIKLDHLTDEHISGSIVFHNVKIEDSGEVECYTDSRMVSENFDLVFNFDSEIVVTGVHFDG